MEINTELWEWLNYCRNSPNQSNVKKGYSTISVHLNLFGPLKPFKREKGLSTAQDLPMALLLVCYVAFVVNVQYRLDVFHYVRAGHTALQTKQALL